MAPIDTIVAEFKQAVSRMYGDKLVQVILYGSYARGNYTAESGIDLAVVLQIEHVERWRAVERLSPIAVEISEKYDCLIAPIVLEAKRLIASKNLFIQTVQQEGIAV